MVHCCYTLCCFPPLHWHSLSTATKTNAGSVKYTLCRTDETAGPRLGLSEAWLDSWMWLKGLVWVCVCGGCVSRHMTGLEYISTCLPDCNNQLQISGLLLDNRGWLRLFNHNIFFCCCFCAAIYPPWLTACCKMLGLMEEHAPCVLFLSSSSSSSPFAPSTEDLFPCQRLTAGLNDTGSMVHVIQGDLVSSSLVSVSWVILVWTD